MGHLFSDLCSEPAQKNFDCVSCARANQLTCAVHEIWFQANSLCFPPSASSAGSLELVDLLLKNGAAPVCQRGTGLSPLHLACEAGHLPVLERLLKVNLWLKTLWNLPVCLPKSFIPGQWSRSPAHLGASAEGELLLRNNVKSTCVPAQVFYTMPMKQVTCPGLECLIKVSFCVGTVWHLPVCLPKSFSSAPGHWGGWAVVLLGLIKLSCCFCLWV